MKKIASVIEYFDKSISEIKTKNYSKLFELQKKIELSFESLSKLRAIVRNQGFSTEKEEINFFKNQKPYIQGSLNYYQKLNTYLLKQPFGSPMQQIEFINIELNDLDSKNCLNLNFVKYLRLKKTEIDYLLFLRKNNQFDLFLDSSHHIDDPEFSTNHDYLVSKIITRDLLRKYYLKELDSLQMEINGINTNEFKQEALKDITWTASNTDLVEALFSFIALGAINNGNVDVPKMVEACKYIFDIDLGNIYNIFAQIKNRKKDPTKFLDKLKFALIKKIEDDLQKT